MIYQTYLAKILKDEQDINRLHFSLSLTSPSLLNQASGTGLGWDWGSGRESRSAANI